MLLKEVSVALSYEVWFPIVIVSSVEKSPFKVNIPLVTVSEMGIRLSQQIGCFYLTWKSSIQSQDSDIAQILFKFW